MQLLHSQKVSLQWHLHTITHERRCPRYHSSGLTHPLPLIWYNCYLFHLILSVVFNISFQQTLDSSVGRAEDCRWFQIADILRSLVQIRLEGFFCYIGPENFRPFFYAGISQKKVGLPFNLRMTTFFKGSMKAAIRQARAT